MTVRFHRSAATLWGIRASAGHGIEVTVRSKRRSPPGIRIHSSTLRRDEVTTVEGIPVTTVVRTLVDLAAVISPSQVRCAVDEAEARRLGGSLSLDDLVARSPGHRGIATIRQILAEGRIGASVTRSELENRFLAFLDDAHLPRPEVNASLRVAGRWREADCLWRPHLLIVELDGHASHASRAAYEGDRARDRSLHAAGWRVVRVTWRQLHDDADSLAADLRRLLADDLR